MFNPVTQLFSVLNIDTGDFGNAFGVNLVELQGNAKCN